jgi:hypothetical protein
VPTPQLNPRFKMQVKIHESYRNVVAICDTSLIGKKFEEGKFQLHVKEHFYKEKEVSEEQLLQVIQKQTNEDATFNIVGPDSISIALKSGLIKEDNISKIQGIPFALTLL